MSYATERAFAEATGTDLRYPRPPHVPVCDAEADWIARELAEDASARSARIASRMADDKADMRARSARDYATEIHDAANRLASLIGQARTDGFGVVGAEEMKDLARNAVWLLREQQEQAHG